MGLPLTERVVSASTTDGLTHAGVLIRPPAAREKPLALLWFPGGFANCLAGVAIGRELAGRGYPFLAGNTRGRDYGFVTTLADGRDLLAGGAWELFPGRGCSRRSRRRSVRQPTSVSSRRA